MSSIEGCNIKIINDANSKGRKQKTKVINVSCPNKETFKDVYCNIKASEKTSETLRSKFLNHFTAVGALTFSALAAIKHKNPSGFKLSNKLATGAKTLGQFGLAALSVGLTSSIFSKVLSGDKELADDAQRHPFLAFGAEFLTAAGVFLLGGKGISKGFNYLKKTFRPSANELSARLNKFKQGIDDSKFAKKVEERFIPAFNKFSAKHPKLTEFASKHNFLLTCAGLFGLAGVLESSLENTHAKEAEKIKQDIKLQELLVDKNDYNIYDDI